MQKKLRNEPTFSEFVFWGLLKQHFPNLRFKRQHPISQYIADFYCHKLRLVIEIDGSIHLSEEVQANDKLREQFLQTLELKIIRFTNSEVCNDGLNTIKKLKEVIDSLTIIKDH